MDFEKFNLWVLVKIFEVELAVACSNVSTWSSNFHYYADNFNVDAFSLGVTHCHLILNEYLVGKEPEDVT